MVTGTAVAMLVSGAAGGMLEEPATTGVEEGMEEEAMGMLVLVCPAMPVPEIEEAVEVATSELEARTLVGKEVGNEGAVIIVGAKYDWGTAGVAVLVPLLAAATAPAKPRPDV